MQNYELLNLKKEIRELKDELSKNRSLLEEIKNQNHSRELKEEVRSSERWFYIGFVAFCFTIGIINYKIGG